MDYFPKPSLSRSGVDVPLVTKGEIPAGEDWATFPKRTNFCDVDGKLTQTLSADRVASLLQAWGFFGLIQILIEQPVVLQDWSRRGDPAGKTRFVRWPSEAINRLLRIQDRKDPLKIDLFKAVRRVCVAVETSKYALQSPVAEIALSVRLLYESACAIDREAWFEGVVFENKFLEQQMLARGWCPSTVDGLLRREASGLLAAYYLLCMERPSQEHVKHDKCNMGVCHAYDVPKDVLYETRHVRRGCQCGPNDVGVDPAALARIVAKDGVPLVSIVEKDGDVSLELSECSFTTNFCAISHVWKDGLGNFESNALPRCQLQRIRQCLQNLPERPRNLELRGVISLFPGLRVDSSRYQVILEKPGTRRKFKFWMDSLCIPAGKGDDIKRLKHQAINRMNLIYAAANRVLVLDESLKDARASVSNMIEMHARIFVSPWMRRSWTLQEGSLAHFCQFQCSDSVVTPAWHSSNRDWRSRRKNGEEWAPRSVHPRTLTMDKHVRPSWQRRIYDWRTIVSRKIRPSKRHHGVSLTGSVRSEENWLERWVFLTFVQMVSSTFRPFFDTSHDIEMKIQEETAQESQPRESLYTDVKSERFITIWNELARRSTTEPDDIYLIFANLLNFSARRIAQVPQRQRFQSIVWSMEVLPLGLLYNRGKRLDDHDNHYNRWVPAELSRFKIDTRDRMRFHEGRLWIQAECSPDGYLWLFKNTVRRCNDFYLKGPVGSGIDIRFTALQRDEDRFDTDSFEGVCILKSSVIPWVTNETKTAPAARFYVRKRSEWSYGQPEPEGTSRWEGLDKQHWLRGEVKHDTLRLLLVYDCPLTMRHVESKPRPDDTVVITDEHRWGHSLGYESRSTAWKIEVECEVQRLPEVRSAAQDGRTVWNSFDTSLTTLSDLGYGYFLLAIPLRIKIAVDIGWYGTTALYKASTILFALVVFTPFHEFMFIADRIDQHEVKAIDIAFVVLSLFFTWVVLIAMVMAPFPIMYLWYRDWARTFDEDGAASTVTDWFGSFFRHFSTFASKVAYWDSRVLEFWKLVLVSAFRYTGLEWFWTVTGGRVLRCWRGDDEEEEEEDKERRRRTSRGGSDSSSDSSPSMLAKYCSACEDMNDGVMYNCSLCYSGLYNLCKECVEDGLRCDGIGHWLTRYSFAEQEWEEVQVFNHKPMLVKRRTQRDKNAKSTLILGRNSLYLSMGRGEESIVIWHIENPDRV